MHNKQITIEQRLFLELLSAAIHDKQPNPDPFWGASQQTWQQIHLLGLEQSVHALIFDKALSLPQEVLPPQESVTDFLLKINQTNLKHKKFVEVLSFITKKYSGQNLSFVLLKGQANALNYPHPTLRPLGDIDIYFPNKADYAKANDWVKKCGYKTDEEALYQQSFYVDGVHIENHLSIAYFGRKIYDKRLQEIINQVKEDNGFPKIDITPELQIHTLPSTFNAFYLFQHILHHFSYVGVSFRQICDWITFLTTHKNEIDNDLFMYYANQFDMIRPMKVFAALCVTYLGTPPAIFPFTIEPNNPLTERVLTDIFQSGNFGRNHFKNKEFSSIWQRRWFMWRKTIQRNRMIYPVSPKHILPLPFVAINNQLKRIAKKIK